MKLVLPFPYSLKTSQRILWVFLISAVLFVLGSFFDFHKLEMAGNVFLVPLLILYYRFKAKKWFFLAVTAITMLYVRDILQYFGYGSFSAPSQIIFLGSLLIFYLFALTGFQKAKVHAVEWISLLIMYGFLGFIFYTISDLIPGDMALGQDFMYIQLSLLTFLLAVTFTQYLIKSHYASLWIMLFSASLLISELSLFFKIYVIDDLSVRLFFPLFHVLAYYALIEHAIHRRRSERFPMV